MGSTPPKERRDAWAAIDVDVTTLASITGEGNVRAVKTFDADMASITLTPAGAAALIEAVAAKAKASKAAK